MPNFATLPEVKEFLGIDLTDSTNDLLITNILSRTTRIIQMYTGRKLFKATATEYHNGNGRDHELVLDLYPIVLITSVHDDVDRTYGDDTLLVEDTDFSVIEETDVDGENPGILLRLDGNVWYKGDQNIKIIYSGGYDENDIPKDIIQAQIDFVSYLYTQRDRRIGIESYRLGQFSVSYKTESVVATNAFFSSIPSAIKDILELYRDRRIEGTSA